MLGVIDVGGGLRGIYGAGVFDYCIEHRIHFDYCIGVSAGSGNVASYIAGQLGRNISFYEDYVFRKEYMSIRNFLHKGSYINMDYVYGVLSNTDGENPLNYQAIKDSDKEMIVVAANALTDQVKYFTKKDMDRNNYNIFKASCCLPVLSRPYVVKGVPYFDGGLADPVPVQKALDAGCDKIVLILTKPRDEIRTEQDDAFSAKKLAKKYPKAAEGLAIRYQRYNQGVELAKKLEQEGRVLIVAPDDTCGVHTLSKNKENIHRLYLKGYEDAKEILNFIIMGGEREDA